MPYKDAEKQKEANKEAAKRYRQLRQKPDGKCELCGWVGICDIHHKDGIHNNNEAINLQTLCANCHRTIEWGKKNTVIPKESVIPAVIPEHSVYQCIRLSKRQVTPTLLNALVDPVERQKLEAICASLATRNKIDRIYYGISGLTMADISSLLEATDIIK